LLAEASLACQTTKSKTLVERRNLIRHWITSFALVEHDLNMRRLSVAVQ